MDRVTGRFGKRGDAPRLSRRRSSGLATIGAISVILYGCSSVTDPDPCQSAASIAINQPVSGTLATTDCLVGGKYEDRWTLSLSVTTTVQVDMGGSFDALLRLTDGSGATIATNDDGGPGFDSRITEPLSAGTYTIEATSLASGATGSYQLSVRTCETGPIAFGESWTGTLSTTDCQLSSGEYVDVWTLTLAGTTELEIDMGSGDFDAFLRVTDELGTTISSDDDGGPGLDARVTATLSAGTYGIEATSAFGAETGNYLLSIATPICSPVGTITVGQSVGATLSTTSCVLNTGEYAHLWTLTISSTTTVQIDLGSSDFDAFLILTDGSGNTVATNDDAGPGLDARIITTLSAATYTITATTFANGETGAYVLTVM